MNELIETERAYVEELLCVLEVKIKFNSDLNLFLFHFVGVLMLSFSL